MNIIYRIFTLILLFLSLTAVEAKSPDDGKKPEEKGWFVGAQAGVPFGVSTFSSFGAEKTHVGCSAGLYGGYSFNSVFSLEAGAKWGETGLSAKDCCYGIDYWLGSDGITYNAPVLGMDGWSYDDLKSSVFVQHYVLQLNVNLLGLAGCTKNGRWKLEVSPLIAAAGTEPTVLYGGEVVETFENCSQWNLGLGGNLQVGCRVTKFLNISLYSSMTYLSGEGFDGIPFHIHKTNYIWESGFKIGFKL